MSNLNVLGKPVCDLKTYTVKEATMTNGQTIKIGFMGLAGADWMGTMGVNFTEELQYTDFLEKGREMAIMLKSKPHKCDMIVALTHLRGPSDQALIKSVPEIDFVLGGHDHSYIR